MVGTLIGQYKIVGIIGSGGMGTVYVGEHTLIKRRAAIKVLKPELSQQREVVDRFFNEARAAAAIQHPGVVQIFDFGFSEDGRAFLVMEQLDGRSLAATLDADGPLARLDALRVIRQVASTIAAVHAAGIIHRDLKPDNIFLLRDPDVIGGLRVKVLDFGIAKLGGAFEPSKTDAGGLFGTPLYMAPEQFDGKVEERSDIYSLGCVMFEALTGRPPFEGKSIAQLVRSHTLLSPPMPSSVTPALSSDIDGVVLACLEKEPARRFLSMAALADALDGLIVGGPPQAVALDPQGLPALPRDLAAAAPVRHCPSCGMNVPPSLRFCETCGFRMDEASAPTAMAMPPSAGLGQPFGGAAGFAPVADASSSPATRPPELQTSPYPPTLPAIAVPTPYGPPPSPRPSAPGSDKAAAASSGDNPAPPTLPPATSSFAATMLFSLHELQMLKSSAPAMPKTSLAPEQVDTGGAQTPPQPPRRAPPPSRLPRAAALPVGAGTGEIDRSRRELAVVFETTVPAGFRDVKPFLLEFFGALFATGRRFGERVVELGTPAIKDLEDRAHYVLFLDDIDDVPTGQLGALSTQMFRARVDPLAQELAALDTPPGSVLIAILAAPQLGQGARETIFALRKERNLFVVPIAASEIRRACESGDARRLLDNRIADLHTLSDPFAVFDGFIDPTRCIGFAAEVADLVRYVTAGGKIVSIAGPPGSGKTSVVAMTEYGCDTHSVARRFVRLSCSQLTRFDPDTLLRELLESIDRIDAEAAGPRLSRGSTPPLEVGLDNLRATIMQIGTRPVGPDRAAAGAHADLRLVRPEQPVKRDQLVIVLEDADWLIRLASSSEPDTARRQRARELWRSLAELCSSGGHTVLVTSIRDFQVMDQVPLERPVSMLRVPLRALNRSESDRLIASLGEPVGFSPTRRALARLHRESGGNVYALRLLCSHVIRAMRERPEFSPLARLVVTPRMVDVAARHIAATGSTFRPHVSVWLDDLEKVVLQHVARQRPRSPRVIRHALEGSAEPAQIARALDALELMGLVESRRGRHRVRIPLFERWIDTHLDAPARLRDAIRRTRASRIAIGCTVTALLFGVYWTWLRSTRSIVEAALGDCTFELDHPDRVGPAESFELFVYQDCKTPEQHELGLEPVRSALQISSVTSNCTPTTASCTAMYKPVAGQQARDVYQVRLRVDGQLVDKLAIASIEKDRFATLRTIGEKAVPAIAFLPLLLTLALTFHKDMKRHVLRLFRRAVPANAPKP